MSAPNHAGKQYDIAIFGATGFTGRLVAEYLSKQYKNGEDLSWAMVGRSMDKLQAVRDEIGADPSTPLIVADASDTDSLDAMTAQAKVVLTTVGPYQLYGNELVAACAKNGADYVDLCGEPAWMAQVIEQHQETAQQSGARIVLSCGFDSIPFDLGVLFLQEQAQKQFGKPCQQIKGRVQKMKGTFSGGTAASLKATMGAAFKDPSIIELLKNPFALTPGFQGPKQPSSSKPQFEEDLDAWVAPFVMAPINTKNVHRSNFLLGHPYGEDFCYSEMIVTGQGERGEATAKAVASDNSLMGDDAPKPGEGPSKEEREAGHYDVLFMGSTAAGEQIQGRVTGDKDPGYGSTSKMIAEAAICLVKERTDTQGGIWTSATAMGASLIQRLRDNAGLTFDIV